ncbi:hypothetical protein [Arthrobacter sp. HLT1-20]
MLQRAQFAGLITRTKPLALFCALIMPFSFFLNFMKGLYLSRHNMSNNSFRALKGGAAMNPKPIKSSIKRIFFAPVDQQKFDQLRDRQYREIVRVDLFNIR